MIQNADSSPSSILSPYVIEAGTYDEMIVGPDSIRPHWQSTIQSLEELGSNELVASLDESKRILRENGVTYNIYDDPKGLWRTWSFDPIPLVMAESDFKVLEEGLVERAEILDQVLRDLYGPREFIRTGLLPPEVIDDDPRYLRPCRGMLPAGRRHLNTYAADVVRGPTGSFVVVEDRTQSPSGSGYALENRIVESRLFPAIYRETQVHRLALFFRSALNSLRMACPEDNEEPRIALLSPGPGNETYFEHAYLAHYLGIILVEGSDLVVSDEKVWLPTLDGLERIHAIIRRVDDSYCDPLELRSDSMLGVPGLLSAIRAGSVVVVNPPGSGICENPALASFLPAMGRQILGREPKLAAARAWWCGIPEHERYVRDHLDQVLIRPIRGRGKNQFIYPDQLTSEQRAQLIARLDDAPQDFAAREWIPPSTAPVLVSGKLEPRELVLRCFLFGGSDSYTVMQGGLTRVAPIRGVKRISSQEGGISKDTWVLSETKPHFVTLLPAGGNQPEIRRSGGEIVSRVAENLFWMGRYAERTEGTARLLRSAVRRVIEARRADNVVCPPDLLRSITLMTTTFPGFVEEPSLLDQPDGELLSLALDADRVGTLAYSIRSLRRTAQSARDRVSDDMWRIIHTLEDGLAGTRHLGELIDPLGDVILRLSAIAGLVSDSMTRGPAFWFLDFGRRIERAIDTTALLRSSLFRSSEYMDAMAEAVLEVTDSVMTYRRRYKSRLHPAGVLDLLLTDPFNPRSVAYQLLRTRELLASLPSRNRPDLLEIVRQQITQAQGMIVVTDTNSLEKRFDDGTVHSTLSRGLSALEGTLRKASDSIGRQYFAPGPAPRQLVEYQ